MLLITCTSISTHSAMAADWWDTIEEKNGFSEFAPPSLFSSYGKKTNEKFEWRSGTSMKDFNKDRHVDTHAHKNPWKPVKSFNGKRTFSSNRPWGKVPEKKPSRVTNMRMHDERFKHWVNQMDSAHQNSFMYSDSGFNQGIPLGIDPLNPAAFSTGNVPGGFVPFTSNHPGIFGLYPFMYRPVNRSPMNFWRW